MLGALCCCSYIMDNAMIAESGGHVNTEIKKWYEAGEGKAKCNVCLSAQLLYKILLYVDDWDTIVSCL